MKLQPSGDLLAGLMFVVVGAGFAIGSTAYSFGQPSEPGPAYFPFGLGVLLALLGCVLVLRALFVASTERIGGIAWRPLLTILGSVALFGALLPRLGLFLAMPLLIVISSSAGREFRWREVLLNAVVLTVACWVIFDLGLNLNIPALPAWIGRP
ncbi:tripartite tricarboxylate transporter TctB family protein [Hydrogenophaga sp. OTU3427]|uniref:tripartite tricarboxylate transporter TctB family protein n=1 Tax=Hydrogenophaga sp. OTU3427 TaxID=3043856 RepID=UPI00313E742B